MVKVSVIVPVYNTEKYLKKCLDSLVNQTLSDIEIIVVNDESPDNSQNIIDSYTKKYSNVLSFVKKNGGLSDTRNFGIKKANGEYIAFIDSDDYVREDMFYLMYNNAVENKSDLVVCDSINVYPKSNYHEYIKSNLKYADSDIKNYLISPPMACTRLFKKSIFDNVEFKKDIFYEDLYLTPKLVKYTNNISFVSEGLYYYLQRDGSIMKQKSFNPHLNDIFDVLESNRVLLQNEYFDEIEFMYISHLLRTATLRFLDYDNREPLIKILDTMKEYFPKWYKNKYLKKVSWKFKIICFLSYNKLYWLLKKIKKLKDR